MTLKNIDVSAGSFADTPIKLGTSQEYLDGTVAFLYIRDAYTSDKGTSRDSHALYLIHTRPNWYYTLSSVTNQAQLMRKDLIYSIHSVRDGETTVYGTNDSNLANASVGNLYWGSYSSTGRDVPIDLYIKSNAYNPTGASFGTIRDGYSIQIAQYVLIKIKPT